MVLFAHGALCNPFVTNRDTDIIVSSYSLESMKNNNEISDGFNYVMDKFTEMLKEIDTFPEMKRVSAMIMFKKVLEDLREENKEEK